MTTECIGLTYIRYVHADIKQQQQLNWSQLDDAKKRIHYFEMKNQAIFFLSLWTVPQDNNIVDKENLHFIGISQIINE